MTIWQYDIMAIWQFGNVAEYGNLEMMQYCAMAIRKYGNFTMTMMQYGVIALWQYGNSM